MTPKIFVKKKSCSLLFVQSKMPKIIVTGLLVQKSCNIKKLLNYKNHCTEFRSRRPPKQPFCLDPELEEKSDP